MGPKDINDTRKTWLYIHGAWKNCMSIIFVFFMKINFNNQFSCIQNKPYLIDMFSVMFYYYRNGIMLTVNNQIDKQ